MAAKTRAQFAAEQIERIQTVLAENPGVVQISVDGINTVYAAELRKELRYWEGELARATGKAATISRIRLDRR